MARTPIISLTRSIRFKLTLFVLILLAVTAFSISFIVTQIMDQVLLNSLIQRGSAITQALATPAGYNLLTNDRLALDNLAAQIERTQKELVYVAILNLDQNIVAHNHLSRINKNLPILAGTLVEQRSDLTIVEGVRDEIKVFEFRRPIFFTDQHVGEVVIGISSMELVLSKATAHEKIMYVAATISALALICVVFLSSFLTRPIKRLSIGVFSLQRNEPVSDIPVQSSDELGLLTSNFNQMAKKIQHQKESLQGYASELESSYNDMVRILAAALDARDNYTYGHSARVARLALGLAEKLNFDDQSMRELELACLLHDIGKIHVPDAILNKNDKLDPSEHQQIVKHPVLGSQILELAPSLHKYIPTVKHHHERYDGTGYPDQLCGDSIPLLAQIVALADTYDAMTSSRPYRKGRNRSAAVEEIRLCSGSQFNPRLTEPFIEVVNELQDEILDDKRLYALNEN